MYRRMRWIGVSRGRTASGRRATEAMLLPIAGPVSIERYQGAAIQRATAERGNNIAAAMSGQDDGGG